MRIECLSEMSSGTGKLAETGQDPSELALRVPWSPVRPLREAGIHSLCPVFGSGGGGFLPANPREFAVVTDNEHH